MTVLTFCRVTDLETTLGHLIRCSKDQQTLNIQLSICTLDSHDESDIDESHRHIDFIYTGFIPIWAYRLTLKDFSDFLSAHREQETRIMEFSPKNEITPSNEKLWTDFKTWVECRNLVNQDA